MNEPSERSLLVSSSESARVRRQASRVSGRSSCYSSLLTLARSLTCDLVVLKRAARKQKRREENRKKNLWSGPCATGERTCTYARVRQLAMNGSGAKIVSRPS